MHVGGKLRGAAVRGHFKAGPLDVARVVSSDPLGRSSFKRESKLFQAEQISSMIKLRWRRLLRYVSSTQPGMWVL